MARPSSVRHLAVAAAMMLGREALALPQADVSTATTAPAASATPITWISVNWEGEATTITPSVITASDGQLTTVSEPPAALTAAATYTISPYGGAATTITGLAPVASQTGTGESLGAVFPACAASDASAGPFCLPRPGAELHPGSMYYLTWSPATLLNTTQQQQAYLQVWYNYSDSSPTHGTTSSSPVNLTAGWLGYPIDLDFFTTFAAEQNVSAADLTRLSLTFVFAWNETGTGQSSSGGKGRHRRDDTEQLGNTVGPTVWLTTDTVAGGGIQNGTDGSGSGSGSGGGVVTAPGSGGVSSGSDSSSGSSSVPAAAIAVPVSVVVVVAVLAGACFVSWRRTGHMPFVGPAARAAVQRRRSSAGYGVRRSRSERVGRDSGSGGRGGAVGTGVGDGKSETNVGIQLTDRDSWSPTGRSAGPGRNVFREEVARQERLG